MTNFEQLTDDALTAVHANLHKAIRSTDEFDTAKLEAHHLVTSEMTTRGLDHGHEDDIWTEVVIEKSTTPRMPMAQALADLPEEVAKSVTEQLGNIAYVDATTILTVNGYSVRFDASEDQTVEKDAPSVALNPVQEALYAGLEGVAEQIGGFDQGVGAQGSHYMDGSLNPFTDEGIRCANCVFFRGGGACEIVVGEIDPEGLCKFWIIPEDLIREPEDDYEIVDLAEPTAKSTQSVSTSFPGATSVTYVVNLPAPEELTKHGNHDQRSHGKWAAGVTDADMSTMGRFLSKRQVKLNYTEGYDEGKAAREDHPDWVEREVGNRTTRLEGNLKRLREEAPPRQQIGSDEFAIISEAILHDQGFIHGATGSRRSVRPPLFAGDLTGRYTLAVGAFGKSEDSVTKHGHHDQKTHGRRYSASVSGELSDSILERVQANGGLSVSMIDGHEPNSGYMVAKGSQFGDIADATDFFDPTKGHKILSDYLIKHKSQLGSGKAYLGLWHNTEDGKVYLDLSENIQDRGRAVSLGRRRDQISIWDVTNFSEIETGGTGAINKGVASGRREAGTGQSDSGSAGLRHHDRRTDRGMVEDGLGEDRGQESPVSKHGHHDQKTHGSWANGDSADGSLSTPVDKPADASRRASAVEAARRTRESYLQAEPEVTQTMLDLAAATGGKLHGLENRLKSTDSLARKIQQDADLDYNGDDQKAAANISDALRYTMTISDSDYTAGFKRIEKTLTDMGYDVKPKNFWRQGDPYQGVNIKLRKDGRTIEVQLHTPESLEFKGELHTIYERYRVSNSTRDRWRHWNQMVRMASSIPRPANYNTLLSMGTLVMQQFQTAAQAGLSKTTGVGTLWKNVRRTP